MTEEPRVDVIFADGIARMTLVNPTRKNAITQDMAAQIVNFCDRVQADGSIGAVIVDAAGDYFCSGADTRDLAVMSASPAAPEAVGRQGAVYGAFVRVGTLPVPTVAIVQGGAVGAGLNLALAADVMVVATDAVLDSGFVARSIHPGGGHLRLLGRSLGYQQAVALGVFGQAVTGKDAVALGLAWQALPVEELAAAAEGLCRLAAKDPELTRRVMQSAVLELEEPGIGWPAAVEVERGVQMWSLGRKGAPAWKHNPGAAVAVSRS